VRLALDAFEISEVAGLADQKAQLRAVSSQSLRHMMAYKPRRAGKENFHTHEDSKLAASSRVVTEV
jgi:hypothetical protein